MRTNTTYLFAGLLALSAVTTTGCPSNSERWTGAEARAALEDTVVSSQALSLTTNTVELTTNFTIGQAVEDAAAELKSFIEGQMPCAEVTLTGATLTVEYGALAGDCTYNGHEISGTHSVTISSAAEGELSVSHVWDALSNDIVEVSGTALVTWSGVSFTRNVVHELTWTRLTDGKSWTGGGDRTQGALDANILEGITIDGSRYWLTDAGEWNLDIDQVEARWTDPVPQSGSYTLESPDGKTLTLSFARADDDTIQVTLTGPKREWSFDVSKAGEVSE